MSVYRGSRYSECTVSYDDLNKIKHLVIPFVEPKQHDSDIIYQFKQGDRLDLLAYHYYGDSQLQHIILLANPQYYSPFDIKPGDYLILPNPERIEHL